MDGEVKIIKLLSGQEVIGKVTREDMETDFFGHVFVESPLTLQPMQSGERSFAISLMPFTWAGRADSKIQLNPAHITCFIEPEESLKTQYMAGLAGLALPSSSPKITLTE